MTLEEYKNANHLTLQKLSNMTGVCIATLSKLTTGMSRPTQETIRRIENGLKQSFEYLEPSLKMHDLIRENALLKRENIELKKHLTKLNDNLHVLKYLLNDIPSLTQMKYKPRQLRKKIQAQIPQRHENV